MSGLNTACTAALVLCVLALPAAAQDAPLPLPAPAPPPAHLAFVEGGVDLVHEGVVERAAGGVMLVDGDVVRTANGRAEIVFADGTVLHLDHDTELEILSPVRLRLQIGRVLLRVSAAATAPYVIDAQAASTRFMPRGEYGVTADRRYERLEVTVARGVAEIVDGGATTLVRSGELASIRGPGGRVLLQAFNSARWDGFERWSSDRINGFAATRSARQLPSELRAYSPLFDSHGRWDYMAPYGNVWFPSVGATWRPYYTGAWSLTRYGWTWMGHDPWSWPTHHYGRWGFTGAAWYWIPHRAWGPAWVSWVFVPGYVSWSPLGWDNRAVMHWGGRPGDHPAYWPNYDAYRAWTIVPRDAFGGRRSVRAHAVDPAKLPEDTRRAIANVAVPRGTVSGIGIAPGAVVTPSNEIAVPRATAPAPTGAIRREANPTDPPRRGGVRAPTPTHPAQGALPPMIDAPAAPSQPAGAVERRPAAPARDADANAPRVYPPGVYAPRSAPARQAGEEAPRRDPARAERPQSGERGQSAERPRPGARSESGERSGSGARPRSGGVAVPRTPGESTTASPPPSGSGGQAGGARRRPPQ
jgi:hypothetical protein